MNKLDERKKKILNAIIKTYLDTGEPVGSRTISKATDLKLSSATIRNEMSDLEEMGYIVQPHTSAGRIPSDKGYRFYVDNLMAEKDREIKEMQSFVIERQDKMEKTLKTMAKLLAANTNYTSIVTAPSANVGKIKFIQLSDVDKKQLLATIVLHGNIVKNNIIHTDEHLDKETLLKINLLLNTSLNGLTMNEITLATISQLKDQAGIHSQLISDVLDAVASVITQDEELQIYTSGATNIFKYPELADSQKASEFIGAFEEKQGLKPLFERSLDPEGETGIQVYIGSESPLASMQDCSVVTATYNLGGGVKGKVGIVGPKRMDYEKVVDNLRILREQMDELFGTDENGE